VVLRGVLQLLVIANVVPSSLILFTLIWRRYVPPKRRFLQEPRGITSKAAFVSHRLENLISYAILIPYARGDYDYCSRAVRAWLYSLRVKLSQCDFAGSIPRYTAMSAGIVSERRRQFPKWRHYSGIGIEQLRKTTGSLSQDSQP
jgi:hypothetical protein